MKLGINILVFFLLSLIVWELILWILLVMPYGNDVFARFDNRLIVSLVAPIAASLSTFSWCLFTLLKKVWLD